MAYVALTVFLDLLPPFGWTCDSAFFLAAHRLRILSEAASLWRRGIRDVASPRAREDLLALCQEYAAKPVRSN